MPTRLINQRYGIEEAHNQQLCYIPGRNKYAIALIRIKAN
jgi:hypothetical protein